MTLARLGTWWGTRQAIRAMRALDDAQLQDLGVARGAIEHAVRNGRPRAGGRR